MRDVASKQGLFRIVGLRQIYLCVALRNSRQIQGNPMLLISVGIQNYRVVVTYPKKCESQGADATDLVWGHSLQVEVLSLGLAIAVQGLG